MLALLAMAAFAALVHGWRMSVPVAVGEPGAERVDCVSYAPFRRPGETPFDPQAFVSEARIEADLRLLASRTACVRTYSVSQGLHAVPTVAKRLGMTVLLGAWLGRDRRENEAEVEAAIGLAREHADTVRAVVVGNEVMLRRELPEAELVGHIERVRRAVPVPVTYADVWEFWLKHPSIAPAVSFVTIHILPYWEDEPVGIDAAIAHVVEVWRDMRRRLPGREILVGETGWPSEGRARRDAVPGRVEQARFVRQFTRAAAEHGIRYNLIEGFDQPWKRALEGAMGGAWGLLDSEGRPKFDWHGPVAPRDGWTAWRAWALGGALLGAAAFALAGRRRGPLLHAAVGALSGAGLGATLAEQARYLVVWNRWPAEGARASPRPRWGSRRAWPPPCGSRAASAASRPHRCRPRRVARRLAAHGRHPALDGWVSMLQAAVLFCAAATVVLHAFDARYRGFDWPLFAPAAVAAALAWIAGASRAPDALEERWLGAVLLAGAALMAVKEGPGERAGARYAALMPCSGPAAFARTSTSRPSSAPTAAGS